MRVDTRRFLRRVHGAMISTDVRLTLPAEDWRTVIQALKDSGNTEADALAEELEESLNEELAA